MSNFAWLLYLVPNIMSIIAVQLKYLMRNELHEHFSRVLTLTNDPERKISGK